MRKHLVLFFAIFSCSILMTTISCSCTAKKKLGPKQNEYKLELVTDYYGEDIDPEAISVKVYKTKDDVDADVLYKEYTAADFSGLKNYINIPENYEVVLIIKKRDDGHFTHISGNLEGLNYTDLEIPFTMSSDKSFIVIFSDKAILEVTIYFTAGDNGQIEVFVGPTKIDNIISGETKEIKLPEVWFDRYTIESKAIPDKFYLFEDWSYDNSIDPVLQLTKDMDGQAITANFKDEPVITFTFTAGENGKINIVVSDMPSFNVEILSEDTKQIKFPESLFDTAGLIKATATPETYYVIDSWSIGGADSEIAITRTMDKNITASFKEALQKYSFKANANGKIEVIIKKGANVDSLSREILPTDGVVEIHIPANRFATGNSVVVTAIPDQYFLFDKWSGVSTGSANPLTILSTMTGTITASFKEEMLPFKFTASANGSIDITVSGKIPNETYYISAGSTRTVSIARNRFRDYTVSVKATAEGLYLFQGWDNNPSGATADTFTLNESMAENSAAITAKFFMDIENHYGIDWIMISEPAQLRGLANATAKTGKYMLKNDIDYKETTHMPIGYSYSSSFNGVINGNNKTIKNAKFGVSGTGNNRYTGLIGYMSGGVISNLTIDSSCVINTNSRILNYTAPYIGSIVGYNSGGSIYNCVNNADIHAADYVGGIVGYMSSGKISNVYNTGNIYGGVIPNFDYTVAIGGILGYASGCTLINAYNTGDIIYAENYRFPHIGGVIGEFQNSIYITNVYNTGTINNSKDIVYTGGVVGNNLNSYMTTTTQNLYFTGNSSLSASGVGGGSINSVGRVGTLSGLESTFNSVAGMAGVWVAGPLGRPVVKWLGEGKDY